MPDPLMNWRHVAIADRARLGHPFNVADDLYSYAKTDIWLASFSGWCEAGQAVCWWSIIHNGKRQDHDGCGQQLTAAGAMRWANERLRVGAG